MKLDIFILKGRGYKLKIKKKAAMTLSFTVGTMLFATTALAEINSKSGYDQLKDAAKYTAESFTEKLSSYTAEMSFVLKDNETIISTDNSIAKFDVAKQAVENSSSSTNGTTKREYYSYSDKNSSISYNKDQDTYYVNEYPTPLESNRSFSNPFKEDAAGDIEKIADALIGNLKDYVVVTENSDGSKELSGSLSEAQIPTIANALVSYQFKREYSYQNPNNESEIPRLTKDVFVKEVKGTAVINKDGLIQSILGTGILSGKDEQGKEHNLTFEVLGKVTNVNSTTVSKPDLSGKKVEKTVQRSYDQLSNPTKYLGTYKNDIVIEKDGKFVKIGERIVDISKIDDKNIAGKYHEEFAKGYENYAANARDFQFDSQFSQDHFNANFSVTDSSGKKAQGNISINPSSAVLYFNINETISQNIIYGGDYNRVFD